MKIIVPTPEISETDGFLTEIDIFNRKDYAENLTSLLVNTQDNIVTALDSPWGTGKSTFIKMWQGYLNENKIKSIVFDAFSNDYQNDPFLTIVDQILHLVEETKNETKDIKRKAIDVAKIISRASIKVALKATTLGALDGTELDELGVDDAIADETSSLADEYISSRLLNIEKDKQTIESFKDKLDQLPDLLGTDKPILFIIDELDRCKPQFAVELLEKIKHFFDVPKIKFVLVTNRPQIEEALKGVYGQGVDSHRYLNKFITLWTTFPSTEKHTNINHEKYINNSLAQMEYPYKNNEQKEAEGYFTEFSKYFKS